MNVQSLIYNVTHDAYVVKLLRYMDDIEYRRVFTLEDLEPVIKLREKAYRSHNVYVRADQPMTDEQDLDPRYFTFAVFWRERLVATLRVHIVTAQNPVCNSRDYYPDVLNPLIEQGLSFMDPTRFAIDPDVAKELPSLPLITLRLGFVAAKHFDTDFCLSMIKEQHMAFYRKVFRSTQMTPFLPFKAVNESYALFSAPKSMETAICQAYPMFRSTPTERNLLFQLPKLGQPNVLNIRPSAKLAIAQQNSTMPELSAAS